MSAVPTEAPGCTNKRRFGSYDEAQLALVDAKIKRAFGRSQKRREERSYYCGNCNGFHLTSQPERQAS
jgi:hypothetical protein